MAESLPDRSADNHDIGGPGVEKHPVVVVGQLPYTSTHERIRRAVDVVQHRSRSDACNMLECRGEEVDIVATAQNDNTALFATDMEHVL